MTSVTPPKRIYPTRSTPPAPSTWISAANVVLGLWLLLSAVLWTHSPGSMTNTWLVGLFIAAVGAIDMVVPGIRWMNALASVWLFLSTFWVPDANRATVWNNAVVALAVFLLSLITTGRVSKATLR